ncbi:MAG: hypothetical protein GY793_10680 [Proteobacteria bacterium]|nr:hypothetical protein [Pseudomonadota bacterium]
MEQQNITINNLSNKGAMFGLDARVALAIFGALSVITGASLYKAIQDTKATALLTEMQDVTQGLEEHYIDTGTYIPIGGDNFSSSPEQLVDNYLGFSNWKGPYLQYESPALRLLDHTIYSNIYLRIVSDADWGHPQDNAEIAFCMNSPGNSCYYWVLVNGVPSNIKLKIEQAVDGVITTDSPSKGNLRYTSWGEIYLKSMPYKGAL